jgi:hypothetical protein
LAGEQRVVTSQQKKQIPKNARSRQHLQNLLRDGRRQLSCHCELHQSQGVERRDEKILGATDGASFPKGQIGCICYWLNAMNYKGDTFFYCSGDPGT